MRRACRPPAAPAARALTHLAARAGVQATSARRRLMRDFKRMQTDPPEGVNAAPMDSDIMKWNAVIFGPEDTAWEARRVKTFVRKIQNLTKPTV